MRRKPAAGNVFPNTPIRNSEEDNILFSRKQFANYLSQANGSAPNTSPLTRDYNSQFGYFEVVSKFQYQEMYDRLPIANRIVNVMPMECWQTEPVIKELDTDNSEFVNAFYKLQRQLKVFGYLQRIDCLSGIGSYGILVLGLDDGKELSEPVDLNVPHKLLYLRTFPHVYVEICQVDTDRNSYRYGSPVLYNIQSMYDKRGMMDTAVFDNVSLRVHHSRVIHIADNREVSEIYGVPRLQRVYNVLCDIFKTLGAAGEMFYKGAYPGFAVQAQDNALGNVEIDAESIRDEVRKWENDFQRWFALKNATITPLTSQFADPTTIMGIYTEQIATGVGIPQRILLGSERGELASTQDARAWAARVQERRVRYVIPFIVRPFIDRLVQYGVLPVAVNDDYTVFWDTNDYETAGDKKALSAVDIDNLSKWSDDKIGKFMTKEEFLVRYCGFTQAEAQMSIKRADENAALRAAKETAEVQRQQAETVLAPPESPVPVPTGGAETGADTPADDSIASSDLPLPEVEPEAPVI